MCLSRYLKQSVVDVMIILSGIYKWFCVFVSLSQTISSRCHDYPVWDVYRKESCSDIKKFEKPTSLKRVHSNVIGNILRKKNRVILLLF